jgi:hypothetical protein
LQAAACGSASCVTEGQLVRPYRGTACSAGSRGPRDCVPGRDLLSRRAVVVVVVDDHGAVPQALRRRRCLGSGANSVRDAFWPWLEMWVADPGLSDERCTPREESTLSHVVPRSPGFGRHQRRGQEDIRFDALRRLALPVTGCTPAASSVRGTAQGSSFAKVVAQAGRKQRTAGAPAECRRGSVPGLHP